MIKYVQVRAGTELGTCADPQKFARGGSTLTAFFFLFFFLREEDTNKYHYKWASLARQRNAI